MPPCFPLHIRGTVLWILPNPFSVASTGLSPSKACHFRQVWVPKLRVRAVRNTTFARHFWRAFGLPCVVFTRCYSPHLDWFLFLQVLRCFNSLRPTSFRNFRDFPFRDLRIKGCVRLLWAFRSLPRPSSLPEPNHPPNRVFDLDFCCWQAYERIIIVSLLLIDFSSLNPP